MASSTTSSSPSPPEDGEATTYTAWDGAVFQNLESFARYEMETRYTFKGETGESETKLPGEIEGQPFDLLDLDDCEVQLLDYTDRVKCQKLWNSKVFVGACSSQVIVSHCRDCTFTVAAREFYAHDSENCTFLLYCATAPEIEAATCRNLTFAPFNGNYPQLQENMQQAGLDPEEDKWWMVLPIVASDSEASSPDARQQQEEEQEVVVPEGCYRLMTEEEYAAQITPWEPLGEGTPAISPSWPAAPPSTGTAGPAPYLASQPPLQQEQDGDGQEVRDVSSPSDQLLPPAADAAAAAAKKAAATLQPSTSTNTLLPALSGPSSPFSSHEGPGGRTAQAPPPTLQQQQQQQQQGGPGMEAAPVARSHSKEQQQQQQPPSSASSSSSLVSLAGAGIGGSSSAAPSPFSSITDNRVLAPPPSSSSLSMSLGGGAGAEEKKAGEAPPPQQGAAGTTLADFDYELWHAAWEARLRGKAEQEQQVARAAQAQAARDLDAFYDRATDSKALRQARNREAEDATLARIAESEARSDENPFRRVLELVGEEDTEFGMAGAGAGPDLSRFRGLMLTLREEGLPSKPLALSQTRSRSMSSEASALSHAPRRSSQARP